MHLGFVFVDDVLYHLLIVNFELVLVQCCFVGGNQIALVHVRFDDRVALGIQERSSL